MRYRITHTTAYKYAIPAHEGFDQVRLRPVSDDVQTCLDFALTIDPPATIVAFEDYYGNAVHDFAVPYLHDRLAIEARSDVVTVAGDDEPLAGPRPHEADPSPPLAGLAADPDFGDEHAEFLAPSTYVALEPDSATLAHELLAADPGTSAFAFLHSAAAYIHDHFEYKIGVTTVYSTVAEVLAGGEGVCQDFSHLLISLCRHAGVPARYVSGYLGNVAESTASHAWAEAFVPPYGWIGVDPTAGARSTDRHIKVAVGRDYADVSVVRGTYRGGGAATLDVNVRSEQVGPAGMSFGGPIGVRGRAAMVQFQPLGTMKQLRQLGAMTQSLEKMTQTMGGMSQSLGALPGMPVLQSDDDAPRQQPQQQQQQRPEGVQRSA